MTLQQILESCDADHLIELQAQIQNLILTQRFDSRSSVPTKKTDKDENSEKNDIASKNSPFIDQEHDNANLDDTDSLIKATASSKYKSLSVSFKRKKTRHNIPKDSNKTQA